MRGRRGGGEIGEPMKRKKAKWKKAGDEEGRKTENLLERDMRVKTYRQKSFSSERQKERKTKTEKMG